MLDFDKFEAPSFCRSLKRGGLACILFFSLYKDYFNYLNPLCGDFD
jgi:hypothetical protein